MILLVAVLLGTAALIVWALRSTRADGGIRCAPLARHQDAWSPDLPTRPYSKVPLR